MSDKVLVERDNDKVEIDLPQFGEVILIIKDGKVARFETKEIKLLSKES